MENILLFNNQVTLALSSSITSTTSVSFYWHWLTQITNSFMLMLGQLDELEMLECLLIQH